ncbi:MAG: AgmX/PglI C-terminal domain-containing protein, partial [Bacteriovoracaceae bacterium]
VVLGSMDPDVIRRILREHIPQFRYCYQKELDRANDDQVSGTIGLLFTIGASGHVSKAGISNRSGLAGHVKNCVVRVLRGIQFPRPLGGGTVEVKQPFNFYPKRL